MRGHSSLHTDGAEIPKEGEISISNTVFPGKRRHVREDLGWIVGEGSSEGVWTQEQAPQGSGQSTSLSELKKHFKTLGVILGVLLGRATSWSLRVFDPCGSFTMQDILLFHDYFDTVSKCSLLKPNISFSTTGSTSLSWRHFASDQHYSSTIMLKKVTSGYWSSCSFLHSFAIV